MTMFDFELFAVLLFVLICSVMICCIMLSGIRDQLCNIDYDLCIRNMHNAASKHISVEFPINTEKED